MKMTLKELQCLVKIIETGSFSLAAGEIGLSQPTMSSHIANLEKAMGCRLLERSREKIFLTGAGKIVYQRALEIIELAEKTELEIQDFQGLRSGRLRIAASTIPGTYMVPARIKQFKDKFPEIEIQLSIRDSMGVLDDLQNGLADIAFTGFPPPEPLFRREIARDRIVIAIHPSHAWAKKKQLSLNDVLDTPILVRPSGSGTQKFFYNCIHKKTNRRLKIFSVMSSSEAMKMAVLAELAPGIISEIAIQHELATGAIVALDISGLSLIRPVYLVLRDNNKSSQACQEFASLFKKNDHEH